MAKGKNTTGAVDRAAELVGGALGSVAGTIESLQAQHPHPVDEARDALAAGQAQVTAVASTVGNRAAAAVKRTKAVVRRTKQAAKKAVKKVTKRPSAAARGRRTVKKAVRRVTKAVSRAKKAGRTAVGKAKRRLKKR
mgnify:CR=1 FL=1